MRQIILFFVLVLGMNNNFFGQKGNNFLKLHASAELTTGLFADGYKTGWGVYATHYYGTSKDGSIAFSAGLASWDETNGGRTKAGMFLVRAGYRQILVEGLYVQGDGGFGVGSKNFSGTTRFVIGGCLGYLFKNKTGSGFDISARVNRGFNRTWLGLGAGYQFKL